MAKKSISLGKGLFVSLLLAGVLVLSACTGGAESSVVMPYNAQGTDVGRSISVEEGFVNAKTELPDTLPIYKNEYPTGQEGPLFDVTKERKEQMADQLMEFLGLLQIEAKRESIATESEYTWAAVYQDDSYEIFSFPNGIHILANSDLLPVKLSDIDLRENLLLCAAMDYIHLENPEVVCYTDYKVNGQVYEDYYSISEETEDVFQKTLNRTFSVIQVIRYQESDEVLIKIHRESVPEELGTCQTLSYSEGLKLALDSVPGASKQNVKAEIIYRTVDRPEALVPCYRFYLNGTDPQNATAVDIAMVDS